MKELRNITIYSLIDPNTLEIRYVGKTVRKINIRYSQHISQAKHKLKKDYCHCWIKSLLNQGKKPIIKVIETTTDLSREKYWVSFYREISPKLTNINNGGENDGLGTKRTVQQKENISKGKLSSKKFEIYELDKDRNIIRVWNNYKPIKDYMEVALSTVHRAIKRNCKIKGKLFVLKANYDKIKPLFVVEDIIENKLLKFYDYLSLISFFGLKSSTPFIKSAKGDRLYKKRFKITHNKIRIYA